jgi:hypothetical protein
MTNNTVSSLTQVKTRRVSNKPSLDHRPLAQVSPILISSAAADTRRRLRHEQRLETYTSLCLLHFVWVVVQRVRELRKMSPRQAYDYAVSGEQQGNSTDLEACYKLQSLQRYHKHALASQAADAIAEALDWYNDLCIEMKERREQGAPSLYELIYAHNKAVHEAMAK